MGAGNGAIDDTFEYNVELCLPEGHKPVSQKSHFNLLQSITKKIIRIRHPTNIYTDPRKTT
jgi:hypothetical protein